jgi:hypothetical protein
MLTQEPEFRTVGDLMDERRMDVDQLVQSTGVEPRVVKAIAGLRYTPSPTQRQRLSSALGFSKDRIVWGHRCVAEEFAQVRL